MLWTAFCGSSDEALTVFESRRTDNRINSKASQGVAAPSQLRYVEYLESVLHGHDFVSPKRVLLTSITLRTLPRFNKRTVRVAFVIEAFGVIQYDYGKRHGIARLSRSDSMAEALEEEYRFEIEDVLIAGDVAIRFFEFDVDALGPSPSAELGPGARTVRYGHVIGRQIFFVMFHTSFHDEKVEFKKYEIDGAYDKSTDKFVDDFGLTATFQKWSEGHSKSLPKFSLLSSESPTAVAQRENLNHNGTNGSAVHSAPVGTSAVGKMKEQVPYGMAIGPRLIRLYSIMEGIMEAACPDVITYRRGELMNTPVGELVQKGRSLFYIVSGVAEYHFISEEMNKQYQINRGESIAGNQIGTGEFYGVSDFVLGKDGYTSAFCLRASTDIVQVVTQREVGPLSWRLRCTKLLTCFASRCR